MINHKANSTYRVYGTVITVELNTFNFSHSVLKSYVKKKPNTPTNHNTGYNTTGNQYQLLKYLKIAKKIITY